MNTTTKDKTSSLTELTLTIPVELKENLEEVALMAKKDLQGLILEYLEEGVHEAMPKIRKEHYFKNLREIMRKHNVPAETIDTLEDNFIF